MFEILPYGTVLFIHISAFIFNFVLVALADLQGLLWLTGKKQTLNATVMKWLHKLIWLGLSISILSGLILFWGIKDYLLTVPAFYTKMLMLLALVINSFFIHRHLSVMSERTYKSLNGQEKNVLLINGGISTTCWVGAVVAAQFLGL